MTIGPIRKKRWFIAKPHNSKEYYVAGLEPNNTRTVIWTQQQNNALKFETSAAAQSYIDNHLLKRKDVHIISVTI